MKIYLAAPLFNPTEREYIEQLATQLEKSWDVYVPHRDGHLVEADIANGRNPVDAYKSIYQRDIAEIRKCDVMLAILDGRTPDEGVCIEIGFAKALNKQVIGLKTDIRTLLPWGNNPMIDGCIDQWVKSTSEVLDLLQIRLP